MLKIHPATRPDCESIINRIEKLGRAPKSNIGPQPQSASENNLLGTIEIPKDLKQLEEVLPQANYGHPSLLKKSGSTPRAKSKSPGLQRVTDVSSNQL